MYNKKSNAITSKKQISLIRTKIKCHFDLIIYHSVQGIDKKLKDWTRNRAKHGEQFSKWLEMAKNKANIPQFKKHSPDWSKFAPASNDWLHWYFLQ